MGTTFRPEDALRRRKKIERALDDLGPGLRESARKILEEWEGEASEERLSSLLGKDATKKVLRRLYGSTHG